MFTLIKNAHIVSPDMEIACGSLLIEDDKIVSVAAGETAAPAGAKVIDAAGKMVLPGFIDLHCHGRNNFDFCDGSAEGVQLIAKNKLAEGVTTLLPTTLTVSEEQLTAALDSISASSPSVSERRIRLRSVSRLLSSICRAMTSEEAYSLSSSSRVAATFLLAASKSLFTASA